MSYTMRRYAVVAVALATLPGCWLTDMMKEKKSESTDANNKVAVISFGGKTVVNGAEFDKQLQMLFAANPQVQQYVAHMPEDAQVQLYNQVTDSLVTQKVAVAYVKEKGLDQTADYQERSRDAHRSIDDQLAVKAFEDVIVKQATEQVEKLSDQELEAFYLEKREKDPMFQCKPFLKNEAKPGEKKEYAPFADVREMVRRAMMQERLNNAYLQQIDELKKKYDVKVNSDYARKFVMKQAPVPSGEEEQQLEAPAPVVVA
jgi:hypothetical protein